jgi:carbon storage regulator CsrA
MLNLTRRKGESLILILPNKEQIELVVTQASASKVGIGIIAPKDVQILRKELIQS